MSCIKVKELHKFIDDFHLGPINFTVEAGTVTAIVGANGSGKSTLIKTMMNVWKRTEGLIEFFDQDVTRSDDWKRNVAYQSQKIEGYDIYTLTEMKSFIKMWYPQFDEDLFEDMVNTFQLPKNKPFHKLSEGMQQKMALSLTIPRQTDVMILDEPTAAIDIPAKKYIMDLLVNWLDRGERSIIFASHEADDIKKLADYLLIIKDGKQIEYVEKETLIERYTKLILSKPVAEKLATELDRSHDQREVILEAGEVKQLHQDIKENIISELRPDLEELISALLK